MASKLHPKACGEGMRQRVNRCLTKLSDRDTEAMAASELDAIAKSLTSDSFSPFLSAIADTRPTDKTSLRRHSLRLISLLSHSHPASSLAPHLPRMLTAALRRLRDPDSSVRAACVDAVRSMAASHPAAVAPGLLRPLADALLHEQDRCAQIASALCLAAAVDAASTDRDLAHHLQRLLPRLVKLLRSNAFKAKPALLSLLGSVAGAGGASTPALLGLLVSCLVEFLSSEDWAARKAAADALSLLAVSEKDRLSGFKSSCLSSFENRRFDKVKIVRESMNRMLEVWRDIPTALDTESDALPASQPPSNPSPGGSASAGRYPMASVSSSPVQSASPSITRRSGCLSSRSPPPAASPIPTTRKNTPPIRNKKLSPPSFRKTDHKQNSDWRVEIAVPNMHSVKVVSEDMILKVQEQQRIEGKIRSKLEARRMLFEKNGEDKGNKLAGLKYAPRMVPFQGTGSLESTAVADDTTDDLNAAHKDGEIAVPNMHSVKVVSEDMILKVQEQQRIEGIIRSKLEARRMLFEKNGEDKGNKLAGLKYAPRMVPFQDTGSLESTAVADDTTDDLNAAHKDGDLSLIHRQLVQIENQQSSLLELLERFIGRSQNGIHSLETEVHGLEMALHVISHDLALCSGRISNNGPAVNTCCKLPDAGFLSSNFWRSEGRYSSRLSISGMQNLAEKEAGGHYKRDKHRFGHQGGFIVNSLADNNPQSGGSMEVASQTC
ncbi:TORTIFOLIA1-like protein 5 isoform X1 [Phoenix dactylifera]|uniref:TORTIFOLIA1-like protein 5 isoform X1 n=1 Tax=Phoenix dactylifera TaxID=42345 RepID=A0A8B9ALA5_PHODC|nr:TORTIFOLIA1-like protein 5 isoform X1 [Phoenix dactylifera]XP_038984077.1 TORTIFOLIA1-like protein 5 isoform X1 [Phoenix dactylifera]XP_038984078.1 TORTIFOLIA1-like protein 5 isoform X1 [Phoenix dactylifera]XP_038984079.1 TORTIFOLIA1-like protein 5 isoform X1 [Phoenix dactylifera]